MNGFKIIDDFKNEYQKNPDKYQLSVYLNGIKTAKLIPVTKKIEQEEEFVKLLAKWRKENWNAYPTVFKVTVEGTKKWIKSQLLERKDRILFILYTLDNEPIGHLGLSNLDFSRKEGEIDNVVRGRESILYGIMTSAMETIAKFSFERLSLERLFLRVFLDNDRAIKLYERCGYKRVREIPLNKRIEGNTVVYDEIYKGENKEIDRYFLLMELKKGIKI